MSDIPVTNSGKNPLPVGPYMIAPGETRLIDEQYVPKHLRPDTGEAPARKEPDNSILVLLDLSIPEIEEQLPNCTVEQLDELQAAEEAGKTRKGVLKAIAEERLRRAAEAQDDLSDEDKAAVAENVELLQEASDEDVVKALADTDPLMQKAAEQVVAERGLGGNTAPATE